MGKCKFRNDWMLKTDKNGDLISSWVSRLGEDIAICKFCVSTVDYKNKGFHAFLQHSGTGSHQKLVKNQEKQMVFVAGNSADCSSQLDQSADNGESTSTSPAQIKLYSPRNAATISELIWVMKSVCCNFSAASCRNIKDTFDAMFPGGVSKDFSLSPKKMNYLMTDALGPYFYKMMTEDVGESYFTICFDETTNVEDKKELQVTIRYWSKAKDEVISRHLQTYFIGKADAQILYEKISCAISSANLLLQKLLMVGSDGPYVNKKVHKLFNENLIEIRSFALTDVGTCPIHTVHNAYLKALQAFGEDSSELAVAIFHYFDGWPARWEDYEKIQENLGLPMRKFVKHSPSRWLTFHYAAERLLEQWEGIIHYFQKFIP